MLIDLSGLTVSSDRDSIVTIVAKTGASYDAEYTFSLNWGQKFIPQVSVINGFY